MTNCYVRSYNWVGRYWNYEDAYITDNGDGAWHVEYISRVDRYERDMSEADAQKIVDRMRDNYEQSKEPQFARYTVTEVTAETVEKFVINMLGSYDWYTDFIENGYQQLAAERYNDELVKRAQRFMRAVNADRRAA